MIFAGAYNWPPNVTLEQRLGDLMVLFAQADSRRNVVEDQ